MWPSPKSEIPRADVAGESEEMGARPPEWQGAEPLPGRGGSPGVKEEQRCQTKGANGRWAGYG
eukprot:901260-Alexandrium_andersonii.AAC.1